MPVLDPFGIREIYPTNTHQNRAKPWYLGIGNWRDRRVKSDTEWKHYSAYWDFNHHLVIAYAGGMLERFPVLALPSIQYQDITYEHHQKKLAKKGFMATKEDWKNVEI